MSKLAILAAMLVATACTKKREGEPSSAPPPPAAAPAAGPTAAGPPPAAAAPAAGKLTCDKVLPTALRDKYFGGAKITDNPQPVAFTGECEIKAADGSWTARVTANCAPVPDNQVASMRETTLKGIKDAMKDAKDLTGVGKGGVIVSMGDAGSMVTAFDDDSSCTATLRIPKQVEATALAKDLLAVLPAK